MNFWRTLNGIVTVQITAADPAQFLSELEAVGIPVEKAVSLDELTLCIQLRRQYVRKSCLLAEKRGIGWTITGKNGLYWKLRAFARRPVLVSGLAMLLFLSIFLPTRLLFFRVEGNSSVPARQIIAGAAEYGLKFGAVRREIRSEKVKNGILKAVPELEWVGINTEGCVATISVRERKTEPEKPVPGGVSNIVATYDGVVRGLTVTAGSALVQPGQQVVKGQILISGYTDCGLSIRAQRAKGEVYAATERNLTVLIPDTAVGTGNISSETKKITLIFGKNRINFSESSGILDTGCVKMYEENYVTLPGGFELPIGFVTERYIYCDSTKDNTSWETILAQEAERYLRSQMIAGMILSREETISHEEGVWCLEGKYVCLEMIGREQREEIITP